jgi:glucokinase
VLAHGVAFGAREVAHAEEAGDPVAARLMGDARDAFAASCVSLADVFNPSLIVVGGSLAVGQGDRLLDPARAAIAAGAFRRQAERVRIVPAALGDDVGLIGALVLVGDRLAESVDAVERARG